MLESKSFKVQQGRRRGITEMEPDGLVGHAAGGVLALQVAELPAVLILIEAGVFVGQYPIMIDRLAISS